MSKLKDDQISKLKSLGIEGSTDAEVRPKILKILKELGTDDVDNDPIDDFINILQAYEELGEYSANTKKEEKKKPSPSPKVKNPEPEEDEDDEETEEEEETEVEEKPKKKVSKKIVEEEETEEEEKEEKVSEKPAKDKVKKSKEVAKKEVVSKDKSATPKKGKKSNNVSYDGVNPDHISKVKKILKVLTDKGLEFNFSNKSCITALIAGSDSQRSIITIESVIFKNEETFMKVVFNGLNLFKHNSQLLEIMETNISEDFHDRLVVRNNSYPFVKAVSNKELDKVCNDDLLKLITDKIGVLDKKLRKNRANMEKDFEK